jgi:hypothetical protein
MADLPNGGEVAPPLVNLKGSDRFFFQRNFDNKFILFS